MDMDKILNELQDAKPTDVGTLMMHYVVDNFKKEDRMNVIHSIIRTFGIDFLSHELEQDDREVLRSLAVILEKQLKK